MFSSILGLYPLDASSNQLWQPKMSPDMAQCPLRGKISRSWKPLVLLEDQPPGLEGQSGNAKKSSQQPCPQLSQAQEDGRHPFPSAPVASTARLEGTLLACDGRSLGITAQLRQAWCQQLAAGLHSMGVRELVWPWGVLWLPGWPSVQPAWGGGSQHG